MWVFCSSFAVVLLVALLLPNRYRSHLKILVKNERASSLISVGDQTQGLVYLNDISEARINTEIELITSSDLLRKVVQRCGLAGLVSSRVKDPARREEMAVEDLRKALTVVPAHRSDVIEVTYQSAAPQRSARVLSAISELYQRSNLELHGAPGSYAFFDKMWKDTSSQLNEAEQELATFKRLARIVSLPEEKSILLQHVADLERHMAESAAGARKSEEQADLYKDSLTKIPASIEKERTSIPNQAATQQLSTMLVTLQNKRAEAVTRYRPEDRIIGELDDQIKLTQRAIENAKNTPAQEVASGANPTFLNAESELVRATAEHGGNVAEAQSLGEQIRHDQGRLMQLGTATVTYDDLVRRTSELSSLLETYRKKRDEASVGEQLDKQNLSNVAVVEQPTVETIPASPRRGTIVALGFLWSIALAIGTSTLLNLMRRRIRTPFELEQALDVPLLAALPRRAQAPFIEGSFPELYIAMQRTASLEA